MKQLISTVAVRHGLDPLLVEAIVMQESGGNTWAMRYEQGYRWLVEFAHPDCSLATERNGQMTSWGAMQVMGAVARERGFNGPFLAAMCDPLVGLEYGCRHLAWLSAKGYTLHELISSWNQGKPRRTASGEFINQQYVDGVLEWMKRIGG